MTDVERHVGRAVDGFMVAFVWLPTGAALWAWQEWRGLICFAVGVLLSAIRDLSRAWPCWQRLGMTTSPCCPDCPPLPEDS